MGGFEARFLISSFKDVILRKLLRWYKNGSFAKDSPLSRQLQKNLKYSKIFPTHIQIKPRGKLMKYEP